MSNLSRGIDDRRSNRDAVQASVRLLNIFKSDDVDAPRERVNFEQSALRMFMNAEFAQTCLRTVFCSKLTS